MARIHHTTTVILQEMARNHEKVVVCDTLDVRHSLVKKDNRKTGNF